MLIKLMGGISIRMIQLCGKEIILPLQLLFKSMLEGIFPDDWKKSNVVPVHKKESTNQTKRLITKRNSF